MTERICVECKLAIADGDRDYSANWVAGFGMEFKHESCGKNTLEPTVASQPAQLTVESFCEAMASCIRAKKDRSDEVAELAWTKMPKITESDFGWIFASGISKGINCDAEGCLLNRGHGGKHLCANPGLGLADAIEVTVKCPPAQHEGVMQLPPDYELGEEERAAYAGFRTVEEMRRAMGGCE